MKRLLSYLKPHKWVMTIATLLVLLIIVVQLYRPIIIGNAIDDVARAFRLIGENGKPFCEYKIGSSEAKPLKEFMMKMKEAIAPELDFIFGDIPFTGVNLPLEDLDCRKTEEDTGFRAEISFREGCRRTRDWWVQILEEEK